MFINNAYFQCSSIIAIRQKKKVETQSEQIGSIYPFSLIQEPLHKVVVCPGFDFVQNLKYPMETTGINSNKQACLANAVLMIRPFRFRCNEMTASTNHFQQLGTHHSDISNKAIEQFDCLASKLIAAGVKVIIAQDNGQNDTPDSVFPNNWISFHNRQYILYPMCAPNRRLERTIDIFTPLTAHGIPHSLLRDYSAREEEGLFLEGTGSIVLDHRHGVAFAAISPRTNHHLFSQFCSDNHFRPCVFSAYHTVNGKREQIYHTNVMMWVGDGVAAVCLECIDNKDERQKVLSQLSIDRQVIVLSEKQIAYFAGNCLMLMGNKKVIAMSDTAFKAYQSDQLAIISRHAQIIHSDVSTIEKEGGGSVRCMLAELF